nr:MAG: replication associated protein [Cressdnaviricota sp.]
MSRSRNWCFTLNNPTDEERLVIVESAYRYLVVGNEVGEQGTAHIQGFICYKVQKTLSAVKKLIGARAHLECMRGSFAQASDYCKKDGDFQEFGELPMDKADKGQNEIDRWLEAKACIEEKRIEDLCPTMIPNLKKLEYFVDRVRVSKRKLETLQGDMDHKWYTGPTGSGKSRSAREEYPDAYIKEPTSMWWDGYEGQDVVIIEDFDKFQVKQGGDMKRWLDRYPFQAQIKGGMMLIRPSKIIVTSQYDPWMIWDDEKTTDAIMRRVKIERFPRARQVATINPDGGGDPPARHEQVGRDLVPD